MNLKYTLGAIASVPLLPLMYVQGKRIKASVPRLPEAQGVEGQCIFEGATKKPLRLLTIGESTIAGVGVATHEEGFSGTLAQALSEHFQTTVDWKVYARSGYAVKRVIEHLIPSITETDVDLIVMGIGGNDAFNLNTPRGWRKEVKRLMAALRTKFPDTLIVFCNMPPIKEFPAFTPLIKFTIGNLVEILGKELQAIVQQYDKVYYYHEVITLEKWLKKLDTGGTVADFFSDGVHPSKLAYQTWARELAQVIGSDKVTREALGT